MSFPLDRRGLLVTYLVVMLALLLAPTPVDPDLGGALPGADKIVHAALFAGLAALLFANLGFRPTRALAIALVLSVLAAAVIELVQKSLPYRSGEVMDFVAGACGASVGAVLIAALGHPGIRPLNRDRQD